MADQVVAYSGESSENKTHRDEDPTLETDGSILANYINGYYKLSMWIPSDLAGRVVGKKGVVISNIKTETKVELINALAPVGDSLWVAVVILGEWRSIIAAYKAVSDIVHGEVDDVVLEYTINRNKPFFIFGKTKMNVIKVLSAKSNVRIYLPELVNPKEQKEYKPQTEPMTLEGNFDNVKKAVALLEQEALQYRERYGDGFSKKLLQQPNGLPVKSLRGQEEDGKVVRIEPRKEDARREEHKRELDTKRDIRSKDEKKDERKIEEVKSNGQKSTNDGNSKPVKVDEKETSNKPAPTVTPINADKQTKPVAAAPEEPTEKHRKSDPVHKVINIRASLVGLLLSKHTLSKASVMNQIQSSTQTVISKFGTIPEKSSSEFSSRKVEVDTKQDESGKNRRRRSASGDSNESSDSEDDSAGSSEDSDDEVSVDLPEILDSHDVHIDKKVINEQEFVIFRIIGHAEENVNMAYDHLERIVKGDRIKDVMENLKAVSRHFVKRESPSKKDRERTDKVVTGSATKPPRKTPAERKPIDEKPSEKDGLWKRGERADKYEPSKEKRTEHSGKFSSSEKKVPTEAATERSKDNNSSAATNSNQESNKGDNHVNKPDKSSDKAAVNRSEKPEKPQLGKFEKRVSGPPAKPYSSESPRSERKGSASSADKKPHPTNKDKSNGDKKSTSAGKQQPNK